MKDGDRIDWVADYPDMAIRILKKHRDNLTAHTLREQIDRAYSRTDDVLILTPAGDCPKGKDLKPGCSACQRCPSFLSKRRYGNGSEGWDVISCGAITLKGNTK